MIATGALVYSHPKEDEFSLIVTGTLGLSLITAGLASRHWWWSGHYTKSVLLVAGSLFAAGIPLTYIIDAHPFVSGGIFWRGLFLTLTVFPIGVFMDLLAGLRVAQRSRQDRAVP